MKKAILTIFAFCSALTLAAQAPDAPQYPESGIKPFELGIWGGLASSYISLPTAGLHTDARCGWSGGLTAQFNTRSLGFRLAAEFDDLYSRFPDEENLYGGSMRFNEKAVTVPLNILLETQEGGPIRGYVGLGGFYRRALDCGFKTAGPSYTVRPDQWGWQWILGYKMGHVAIELESRWQIGRLFEGATDPTARLNATSIKLGYIF